MAKKTKISQIEINQLLELIHEGYTYRKMAEHFSVKLATLADFIAKPEHSARVREALQSSANEYANMAEQVLKDAKSNLVEVQRARELAQHYRWMASKRAPKIYGDKMDITTDGEAITTFKIGYKKPGPGN